MNSLIHRDEFVRLLADYQPSPATIAILSRIKLLILVATTSSGRNTIAKQLLATNKYRYIVSDTTRQPRANNGVMERDGVEYWFRSEEVMLEEIRAGDFLEAAVIHDQQVAGVSARELAIVEQSGLIGMTDVEIDGADHINRFKPDAIIVFVVPPSFEEWQRRLKARGTMDEGEFRRRMQSAVTEYQHALDHSYYKFVINDSIPSSLRQINSIVFDGIVDKEIQDRARVIIGQLLSATEKLLKQINSSVSP